MSAPFFVAETPRAGEWGHRFILPPDCSEGSSLAAEFCRNAAKHGAGKNFVGVTQPVVQQLSNGAVRQGVETLVLVGVDYARLDNDQKQHVMTVLARRLADLETLVTQRIDWKHEGQSLVVTRQEFGNWLREDGLRHFPSAPIATGPIPERRRLRLSHGLVAGLVLISLVGGKSYFFTDHGQNDLPPKSPVDHSPPHHNDPFQVGVQMLGKEIGRDYNDVLLALYKMFYPNSSSSEQQTILTELKSNGPLSDVIKDYIKTKKINPVEFIDGDGEKDMITAFLGQKNRPQTAQKSLLLRQQLANFGKALLHLREALQGAGIEAPLGSLELDKIQPLTDENPASPFFVAAQDANIISLLQMLLKSVDSSETLSLDNLQDHRPKMLNVVRSTWGEENVELRKKVADSNKKSKLSDVCGELLGSIQKLANE